MKTFKPRKDKIDTVATIQYLDGRIWEVRVHHNLHAGGCWIPTVWLRVKKDNK